MARKKVTMDRVFETANQILDEMRILHAEFRLFSLKNPGEELNNLVERYQDLHNRFANLITLGQDDAWRFFALSNGFVFPPDEENPDK